MAERSWQAVHLDDLDRIPVEDGLEWRPIRRRLRIGAFGMNAYTADGVGRQVVEDHAERSGQEEVYLVVRGRARFTLDGEPLDAPAGTLLYLPDGGVRRAAVSEEDGTIVLAVGGWPDKPFEPSSWEWFFEAYGQPPERAIATMRDGLEETGERAELLYHLACIEARAGRTEEALPHLRRAIELDPAWEERALEDDDVKGLLTPGAATDSG